MAEQTTYATVKLGGNLIVERCELAGWMVRTHAEYGMKGMVAAFSDSSAMLEWLKSSLELSLKQGGGDPDGQEPGNKG